MAKILHQLMVNFIQLFTGFQTSQVVQDFFHQQYVVMDFVFKQTLFPIHFHGRNGKDAIIAIGL